MASTSLRSRIKSCTTIENLLVRKFFAEFLGTFILIAIGAGSVAQEVLGSNHNDFMSINWAWGVGVALGVWMSASVSGGHLNPAVSLASSIMGRLPWLDCLVYMTAQYLGAFVASSVVFGVYYEALDHFDGGVRHVTGPNATAGIWATYPAPQISWYTGLADQIFGTSLLVLSIMTLTDKRNSLAPPAGMVPFCVGLSVLAIGLSFGMNAGYAINPARDLGPRLFTLAAGWGVEVFSFWDYNWFWIPVVGPHIGAILGAWVYLLLVGNHLEGEHVTIVADATEVKPDYDAKIIVNGQTGQSVVEMSKF